MDSQELTLISFAGIFYIIIAILIVIWAWCCGNKISFWVVLPISITIIFGMSILCLYRLNYYTKCCADSFIAFLLMATTKIWTYISPSYDTWNFNNLIPITQDLKSDPGTICEKIHDYERPLKYSWGLRNKIYEFTFSSKCELMISSYPNILDRLDNLIDNMKILPESGTVLDDLKFIFQSLPKNIDAFISKKKNNVLRLILNALGVSFRKTLYTNIYWETLLDPFSSLRRMVIPLLIFVILGYIFWPTLSEFLKFVCKLDIDISIEESPVKMLKFILAAVGMLYIFRFLLYLKYHISDEINLNEKMYENMKTLQDSTHSFRNGFEITTILCIVSFLSFKCFEILQNYDLKLNVLFACSSVSLVIISIIVLTSLWMFKKVLIDKCFTRFKVFEKLSDFKYIQDESQKIEYNDIEYEREWVGNQTKLRYLTFDHVKRNPNILRFETNDLKKEAFYLKKHILCDTENSNREDFKIDFVELEKNKFNLMFSSLSKFIGKRKFICIYPIITALLISYCCLKVYEMLFPPELSPVEYDEREMFMQLFYITLIGCIVVFYILDVFDIFNYPIFRKINIGDIVFLINAISVFIIFVSGWLH